MPRNSRHASSMVLVLVLLWAKAAFAQSLTIYRDSTNTAWLGGNSSLDIGYRIQASLDFQNWEDISDSVSGPLSYRLDTSTAANRFLRMRTWSTQDAPITLVMVGDSTVADFALDDSKFSGWGQGVYAKMKSNVRVVNLAVPLLSSKLFLTSMQEDSLVKIAPDFVLIQFGWVDQSSEEIFHTSVPDYEANLKAIVQIVRDFKGTPILVTPTGPRWFDNAGKVVPVIEERRQAVRHLAAESQTYLIDLNGLLANVYNELGPTKSVAQFAPPPELDDAAHFSLNGADLVAGLVVDAFPGILRSQVLQQ